MRRFQAGWRTGLVHVVLWVFVGFLIISLVTISVVRRRLATSAHSLVFHWLYYCSASGIVPCVRARVLVGVLCGGGVLWGPTRSLSAFVFPRVTVP